MANKDLCKMHDTAIALQECIDAIEAGEYNNHMSDTERRGLDTIFELALYLVNDLEYDVENILSREDNKNIDES